MFDTIRFTISARLKPSFSVPNNLPEGWSADACGVYSNDSRFQKFRLECAPIGLRVWGDQFKITSVEVSLPRILFGHNGRLIQDEQSFIAAMVWLNYFLRSILDPLPPNDGLIPGLSARTPDCHFTRIDLCWHLPGTSGVLASLGNAQHERIRSLPSFIRGETVSLRGSFLQIVAYDKVREMRLMRGISSEIHRVEIRFKNKALTEVYPYADGNGYRHLTFSWGEQMMRKVASETHARILPSLPEKGIHQFLAFLETEWPLLDATENYVRICDLSRESARKFRKKVQALKPASKAVHTFASLFPLGPWPSPPEVRLEIEEQLHNDWLLNYPKQSLLAVGSSAS